MPEPRRRWLQLHLSTAIALMFVAGGLIWANLLPYERESEVGFYHSYGWPYLCATKYEPKGILPPRPSFGVDERVGPGLSLSSNAAFVDALICAAVLAVAAILLELALQKENLSRVIAVSFCSAILFFAQIAPLSVEPNPLGASLIFYGFGVFGYGWPMNDAVQVYYVKDCDWIAYGRAEGYLGAATVNLCAWFIILAGVWWILSRFSKFGSTARKCAP